MLLAGAAALAGEDLQMGVWKLNTEKSHFTGVGPRSVVEHFKLDGDKVSYRREMINETGQAVIISYVARFDGREYPMYGNSNADSVILRRIDDHTIGLTYKKGGRIASQHTRTVSNDGRVATLNARRRDSRGTMLNHAVVLDRIE